MRKRKKGRKLSRKRDQRKSLLKALASALVLKERIKTTEAKAKETSRFIEKKISRAKVGNLAAQKILAKFFTKKIVKKLMTDIGPRYKNRKGGYTRIIKLGFGKINGAKMAIIELVK